MYVCTHIHTHCNLAETHPQDMHFVNATTDRDYFLIQGLVLCYGVLIVAANLIVDLVLVALNPKLRSQGAA